MMNKPRPVAPRWVVAVAALWMAALCASTRGTPAPVLYGTISPHTNVEAWIGSMAEWGTQRFYLYSTNYRGRQYQIDSPVQLGYDQSNFTSIAFLTDLDPGYAAYINHDELREQEALIKRVEAACAAQGIEFGYMMPFPLFPVQKLDVVRKVQPKFIGADGRLDISAPAIPALLQAEVRRYKRALPRLRSVGLWLAEGCGEIYKFQDDDLVRNAQWMPPIVRALDKVCAELQIEGIVFAHDYFHTVGSRHRSFQAVADFPRVTLMEDSTWPEENTLMPFFGHLTADDRRVLRLTPILANVLTDTEYVGQGNWPAVLTRWWQRTARAASAAGVRQLAGRTFFWDNARTDRNFNRLNAHLLVTFARNPEADPRAALAEAAHEAFGPKLPQRLIDLLWETEPVIQSIIATDGISPLSHSGFPRACYLDHDYFDWPLAMKAVDDLFSPPGTSLAPPLTDGLNAGGYWRFQRQTAAQPAAEYLREKDDAIVWLQRVVPEVEALAASLPPDQQRLFVNGYRELLLLARGMRCFVEAARIHYDWHRAHRIDRDECLRQMRPVAARLRELAASDPGFALGYAAAMRQFANEIETLRISRGRW